MTITFPEAYPCTADAQAEFVATFWNEFQSRGYSPQRLALYVQHEVDGPNYVLFGDMRDEDGNYIYIHMTRESWDAFVEAIANRLEYEWLPTLQRRERALHEKAAEVCELAERLGLDIPKYTAVADMLREHFRTNLVELRHSS